MVITTPISESVNSGLLMVFIYDSARISLGYATTPYLLTI